jgi:hypothetical protein
MAAAKVALRHASEPLADSRIVEAHALFGEPFQRELPNASAVSEAG